MLYIADEMNSKTDPVKARQQRERKDNRATMIRLALDEREKKLRPFNAYQECPKCRRMGFYLIWNDLSPWELERKCSDCGYIWVQAK